MATDEDRTQPALPTRVVLLVDDDRLDRMIIRELLEASAQCAYEVREASSVSEGLEMLKGGGVDVGLIDFYLTDGRGTDLLSERDALGLSTPLIVLTGDESQDVDNAALAAGAADYLSKSGIAASDLDRAIRFACRQAELLSELSCRAATDPLTGLANRTSIHRGIEERLSSLGRSGGCLAVLYVDLDGFKRINDTLGHSEGDRELLAISEILRSESRGHDLVGRPGGDEFVVVATFGDDGRSALNMAHRMSELIAARSRDGVLRCGASIGVVITFDEHDTADELLWRADAAMYKGKAGAGSVHLYDDELRAHLDQRRALEGDLRDAIASGAIEQRYEVVVHLKTGIIAGFDARPHWKHPTLGLIQPSEMRRVAVEAGELGELTNLTLRQACATVGRLPPTSHGHPLVMGVSITLDDLANERLVADILAGQEEHPLGSHVLGLELCEPTDPSATATAARLDADATEKQLRLLGDLGVRLALREFGLGHMRLHRLGSLPFTHLKFPKSYATDFAVGDLADVVAAVAGLADSLNMHSIASGIDEVWQRDAFIEAGFHYGKGALISGRLTEAELHDLQY